MPPNSCSNCLANLYCYVLFLKTFYDKIYTKRIIIPNILKGTNLQTP